jgi:uncharacterized protein (DUF1501 family)
MNRRDFLMTSASGVTATLAPSWAHAQGKGFERLLILVELKGANDGLNTVVPFQDPAYASLRPRIGLKREDLLHISDRQGLHPALKPVYEQLWNTREMAVIEGVGYPQPNLSHFRSIEIWDTASRSDETLQDGWLARAFAQTPAPQAFAADGVIVGSGDMGPLATTAATQAVRTVAVQNPQQFLDRARLADAHGGAPRSGALSHILRVEGNIQQAAQKLHGQFSFKTAFPQGDFGNQVRTAAQIVASQAGVAALRLSLGGFDTHQNQLGTHATLLKNLAEGLVALKVALQELNRWDNTLVLTYSEFGRRPRENQSGGTDHGTAGVQFAFGGKVKSGLYGQMPAWGQLDGSGNVAHTVDFRAVYATVLEKWWGMPSERPLNGRFQALAFV